MFDIIKVNRLVEMTERLSKAYPNVYLVLEEFNIDSIPMLKCAKFNLRAVLQEAQESISKNILGVPLMRTVDAVKYFDSKSMIVIVKKLPLAEPLKEITINVSSKQIKLPALMLSTEEVSAMLDRMTLMNLYNQYNINGVNIIGNQLIRLMRGLTTFTGVDYSFKFQMYLPEDHVKPKFDIDDTGIVIQGPLMYENNFTIRTAEIYRARYPKIPIVISTWKGEATEDFRNACKNLAVVLLENDPPEYMAGKSGIHTNHQIKSSFQGVNYINNYTNAKYTLKCRADQRINRPDFLMYFRNLLKAFPPYGDKLKRRLISMNHGNMSIWFPFQIDDFLSFGFTSDIFNLYSIKFQNPNTAESNYMYIHSKRYLYIKDLFKRLKFDVYMELAKDKRLLKYNKMISHFISPESYIMKSFYEQYIAPIDYTKYLETYWKFMHDYLIVIDDDDIYFDWQKHDNRYFTFHSDDHGVLDHGKWLHLYNNLNI